MQKNYTSLLLCCSWHSTTVHDIHDTFRTINLKIQDIFETKPNVEWSLTLKQPLTLHQYNHLAATTRTLGCVPIAIYAQTASNSVLINAPEGNSKEKDFPFSKK